MERQIKEWGYFEWLNVQNDRDDRPSMNIGLSVISPNHYVPCHIHYENEQFLYILEGSGTWIINGTCRNFTSGDYCYVLSDSTHETINTGVVPVRELSVSMPLYYQPEHLALDLGEHSDISYNLNAAIEAIRVQLLDLLHFPITIFDRDWNILFQNRCFPKFCSDKCISTPYYLNCDCMMPKDDIGSSEVFHFTCLHNLTVYHFPIYYNSQCIGAVRGGHIFCSNTGENSPDGIYDTKESSTIAIQQQLQHIVRSIISFFQFNILREDIQLKNNKISETECTQDLLKQDLRSFQNAVMNLKINHHFLFNTLTALAGMALEGDRYLLYRSILDLSSIFRYSMITDQKFVPLSSELEYLNRYLKMQRLRYGESLIIASNISSGIEQIQVPYNFLQPVAENAFIHGFLSGDNAHCLDITVRRRRGKLYFTVKNNGILPDTMELKRINLSLTNNSGHGLSMIYSKLQAAYGQNFTMSLKIDSGNFCVSFCIPAETV